MGHCWSLINRTFSGCSWLSSAFRTSSPKAWCWGWWRWWLVVKLSVWKEEVRSNINHGTNNFIRATNLDAYNWEKGWLNLKMKQVPHFLWDYSKLNTEAKEWREAAPELEKTGTRFEFTQAILRPEGEQYVPIFIWVDCTCSFASASRELFQSLHHADVPLVFWPSTAHTTTTTLSLLYTIMTSPLKLMPLSIEKELNPYGTVGIIKTAWEICPNV